MMKLFAIAGIAAALVIRAGAEGTPDVRFEQRIGQQLPMNIVFTDEGGNARPLGSFFNQKPVILFFNYFRCPELCSLVAGGAVDALRQLKPTIGRDYTVISVSIDPGDTPEMARSQRQHEVQRYGRTGTSAGWHTLVGSPASIRALTAAAGFHFVLDPRSRQYAHPSGLVVVTPRGVVSSYFLGVDFPAPQVVSALRRAGENRTGSSVYSLLFICFEGGPPQGEYGRLIWLALSVCVALTVAVVLGGILWMLRNERRAGSGMEGST
jgi:protein SCO1/2